MEKRKKKLKSKMKEKKKEKVEKIEIVCFGLAFILFHWSLFHRLCECSVGADSTFVSG